MRSTSIPTEAPVSVTLDQLRQVVETVIQAHQAELVPGLLLRLPRVMKITGWGRSSLYAEIKDGEFPQPVNLGRRAVAWRSEDIIAWRAKIALAQWKPNTDERRSAGRKTQAEAKRRAKLVA